MSIWVTGDMHSNPIRLSSDNFPQQKELTKDDYVIITGDFGLVWDYEGESKEEKYWLDWLEKKRFTTLFADGNHSNFDRLDAMPVKEWHGGKVHEIRPLVLHLMRGQIFDICGQKIFTFGGASSHDIGDGVLERDDPRKKQWSRDWDKQFRINHISWWERELPSDEEMEEGMKNLKKAGNKVDFIITHSPCTSILKQMDGGCNFYNPS